MIEIPEAATLARQLVESLEGKRIDDIVAGASPHKFAWYYGDPEQYPDVIVGKTLRRACAVGGMVEAAAEDVRLLFSEGANLLVDFVRYLVVDIPGDAHPTGGTERFQPGRKIDALSEGVIFIKIDIPQVNTDPQFHLRIRFPLYSHGAFHRIQGGTEIEKEGVPHFFDQFALAGFGLSVQSIIDLSQGFDCLVFISGHQPAETAYVDNHYNSEAVLFLFHV